jgi:CheY-like chemotaxis protein
MGMDGKQALKEIKNDEELATIPIVLFSTSSSPLDIAFAERENVELITKPSSEAAIHATIKKILGSCSA